MDRTFEFNIREHIYSLPRMIIDFAESTLYQSCDLAEIIESHNFKKILFISNVNIYSVSSSISPFLKAATNIPVDVLLEADAEVLISNVDYSGMEFEHTLVLSLFPNISNANSVSILDGFRRQSAYVVSFTDYQTTYALQHSNTVINLKTPALNKYLPVRNYTMSLLALSSLCKILDIRREGKQKRIIETIIDEIKSAAFILTQTLNIIDSAILSYAQSIYNETHITFIGENTDSAQAYLSNLYLSKYTLKHGKLYNISDVSEDFSLIGDDCVILFTSLHNQTHSKIKNEIENNHIQAKSLCIVTDDPNIIGTKQYSVIHTPLINKSYSIMFQAVVPSLLVGYLFP